jgi:hypothetical protein
MILGRSGRWAIGYSWLALGAFLALAGSACSSPPKPLPGGPPPEYEMPRTYNGLGGPAGEPGAPAAPTPPGAPRPEPDPVKPGDPEAAPPPPAPNN